MLEQGTNEEKQPQEKAGNQGFDPNAMMNEFFGDDFPEPIVSSLYRAEVLIDTSRGLLNDLIDQYVQEANRIARARLRYDQDYITKEVMKSYIDTALFMRVQIVHGLPLKDYNGLKYNLHLPSFIYVALSQVGKAKDKEHALILFPILAESVTSNIMTKDNMQSVSELLSELEDYGFKQVVGLPKDVHGALGYMATHLIEEAVIKEGVQETDMFGIPTGDMKVTQSFDASGRVLSWRKEHPLYGFIGSILAAQQMHSLFNRYAFSYGVLEEYRLGLYKAVKR